jgi:lipopolysaccharide export system permease protein
MRILDRLVVRDFVRLFALFILAAPFLFILGDVTEKLDSYLRQGLTWQQIALGYLYQMPMFVSWGLPVAALIATIFTVNNMTRHSEVAAAKASGVSFFRLFAALPVLGVLLTVLGLGLVEVVPVGTQKRAEVMGERQATRHLARSDFIYRDQDGRAFAIRRLDVSSGHILGITMERPGDEPEIPSVHIFAPLARYDEDNGWTLYDGYLRLMSGADVERAYRFSRLQPRGFDEPPERLVDQQKDPEMMRYAELGLLIRSLQRSGSDPRELMVERAQKLAIPVAALIIILFGAPLANSAPRAGAAYGVGVSLAVTIIYLMLFKVAGAAGNTGAIAPGLAAWLPNMIFGAASLALLTRVRT